jgi:quinol monooxygenase YgiN
MLLVIGRVKCDAERRDAHFAQPHLHEFSRRLLEIVSERPEVAIHEVSGTKGFPGAG